MGKKDKDEDEEVSKQSLKLRLQKKIASGLVNKSTLKTVLSDEHFAMIENLYQVLKIDINKKDANKFVNNLIKIVTKIVILQKNNQFKPEEIKSMDNMAKLISRIAKAAITFWDDKDLCDPEYFSKMILEAKAIIAGIAKTHLTGNSQKKVEFVFDIFSDVNRLTRIFISPTADMQPHVQKLSASLRKLVESNEI